MLRDTAKTHFELLFIKIQSDELAMQAEITNKRDYIDVSLKPGFRTSLQQGGR